MKETIKLLLKKIDREVDLIIKYIQDEKSGLTSTEFDKPITFSTNISDEQIKNTTKILKGRKGIYIFLTTSNFLFSKEKIHKWNNCTGAKINPQESNGNLNDFSVEKHQIFYLGSCYSESLLTRIRKHCISSEDTKTASLKLGNINRAWMKTNLQVYAFPIKNKFSDDELHLIITGIEKELHNRFITISGSSRT